MFSVKEQEHICDMYSKGYDTVSGIARLYRSSSARIKEIIDAHLTDEEKNHGIRTFKESNSVIFSIDVDQVSQNWINYINKEDELKHDIQLVCRLRKVYGEDKFPYKPRKEKIEKVLVRPRRTQDQIQELSDYWKAGFSCQEISELYNFKDGVSFGSYISVLRHKFGEEMFPRRKG